MSQPNTSDLVSTIATQLNVVIVALRLLVEMIQNPDATLSASMTPGTCPSRPPASPASPLFRTTTAPTISWAPCDQPDLALILQKTPTPTSTSSAGQRTPLAHPSSPILAPRSPPSTPPSCPLPSPSLPVADAATPSSPAPLSFPPSPILSPHGFAYSPPSPLPPPPSHSPSPSCSLVSSAPRGPLPPRPHKRLLLPPPLPAHPLDHTQTLLGTMIGVPKMTTFLSPSNATNGFDPAGAISLPRCSVPSPRFEHVGLNFLTYKSWLHPDRHP